MQTSISFVDGSSLFPPLDELERLERYADNERIYMGELEPWSEQADRVRKSPHEPTTYETILNFQKLISVKTADLLFEEDVEISTGNDELDDKIHDFVFETKLNRVMYQSAIDVSRYGDSIILVTFQAGKPKLSVVSPMNWIPVCNPYDYQDITHHVIWFATEVTKYKYNVTIQIHEVGKVTQLVYQAVKYGSSQYQLHKLIDKQEYNTGLHISCVYVLQAKKTTSQYFGEDDYSDINSIIAEMQVTIAQIARLQDKYTAPMVTGSMALLKPDRKGNMTFRGTDGFVPSSPDAEFKFVTPDMNLDPCFKKYDTLMNALATISEMGTLIVDFDRQVRANTSAKAMKLNFVSPLAKVKRYKNSYSDFIRDLVYHVVLPNCVKSRDIEITFQDGLPQDQLEQAQIQEIESRISQVNENS